MSWTAPFNKTPLAGQACTLSTGDFQLTLLSSRNATGKEHQRIIKLMEAGKIDITPWITQRSSSTSIAENFLQWMNTQSAGIKTLVDW